MAIRGVTFDNQIVTAVDHGVLFGKVFSDGKLKDGAISYSGSNLTIAAGYYVIAGRLIQITSPVTLTAVSSGAYSRAIVTIDMSQPSTETEFQQVSFSLDYAATPTGFAALTQNDINVSGASGVYQAALVILVMSGATFSSVYDGPYEAKVTAESADSATTATSATQLATSRNFSISDNDGTNTGPATAFKGVANAILKLPATIKAAFIGNLTGNASTATKLASARTFRTNLASTSTASFDGSANVAPGVTGTLPVGNGGTGQTTLTNAANSLINSLGVGDTAPTDTTYIITQSTSSSSSTSFTRRPASYLWTYIKSKITASDIPNLPASKITSGTFATARIADSAITDAKVASGIAASKITGASTTLGAYTARRVYISTSSPSSSAGSIGDIWIKY